MHSSCQRSDLESGMTEEVDKQVEAFHQEDQGQELPAEGAAGPVRVGAGAVVDALVVDNNVAGELHVAVNDGGRDDRGGISRGLRVHEALVEQWVNTGLVGHISRDATAIEAREKPIAKPKPPKAAPRKKGRPRRGEVREARAETRLQRQCRQSAPEALAELPVHCDVGTKKNSKGYKESWIGYKLHADVSDCGLPISLALTAASLQPGNVPIIDKNGRGQGVMPLTPHEAARCKERTVAERFNGRLEGRVWR